MMKRFLSMLLALILVLSAVPYALAEDKPVIVVGIPNDPNVLDFETNYFTLRLEEMAGVDLQFMILPHDKNECLSKLTLMISSGTKLPDVLCLDAVLDATTIYQYGSRGVFLPLEDYMADAEKMPYYFANVPEDVRHIIQKETVSPDGHNYGLSKYSLWPWNTGAYRMWVNDNWLEKLGLSMPTTLDEFHDVLVHFVNDDPNGNGIKDEIGIVGANTGWATNVIPFLMNAFVYANPDKQYLTVENGQVKAAYVTDEWKQGLEFMHQLVEEGLLSTLSFTQDNEQLRALVRVEGGVAGFVPSGSYGTFDAGHALEYDEMNLVPPFVGPNGQVNVCYNPSLPEVKWFITRDCSNIEAAMRLGDCFYEEETSMDSRYGEKGVEWDDDAEGCKEYVTRFYESDPSIQVTFYSKDPTFWGQPQNKNWCDRNPKYMALEKSLGEGSIAVKDIPEPGKPLVQAKDYNPDFNVSYWPHMPTEYISSLIYTEDETEQVAVISADIFSFVQEMAVAFITGNRSINEWDSYLATLNNMGLETYLKVVQAAYDRSL